MSRISVSAGNGGMHPTAGRGRSSIPPTAASPRSSTRQLPRTRAAVAAARAAFDDGAWPATPPADRAALLDRIADLLQRDKEDLATLETRDTGKTLTESRIDIDDVTSVFRYYSRLAGVESDRLVDVGDPAIISRVVRQPIGVCVLIAPWNYPLLQMSWKIAPALAAGCTMVAKPSEVTPLTTIAFAHMLDEAGVPASVVNLVQGSGATLGAALTDTAAVDFISFTGESRRAGPSPRPRRNTSPRWHSNWAARTRTSCSPTPNRTAPSTTC